MPPRRNHMQHTEHLPCRDHMTTLLTFTAFTLQPIPPPPTHPHRIFHTLLRFSDTPNCILTCALTPSCSFLVSQRQRRCHGLSSILSACSSLAREFDNVSHHTLASNFISLYTQRCMHDCFWLLCCCWASQYERLGAKIRQLCTRVPWHA